MGPGHQLRLWQLKPKRAIMHVKWMIMARRAAAWLWHRRFLQVAGEVASISRWHKSLGQEKSAGEVAYSLRSLGLGDVASISR